MYIYIYNYIYIYIYIYLYIKVKRDIFDEGKTNGDKESLDALRNFAAVVMISYRYGRKNSGVHNMLELMCNHLHAVQINSNREYGEQ